MSSVDYEWIKKQFGLAKVGQIEGDTIMALLKAWETAAPKDPVKAGVAIELFKQLSQGYALVEESEEVWAKAKAGYLILVGDRVRVSSDAFPGEAGVLHNGRRGRVVAKRSGDVIVRVDDASGLKSQDVHYPWDKLEKQIK